MRIISSKTLRNDYAGVTAEAHESGESIFVTENGAEDVDLMSHEAFLEREAALNERAEVLEAEAEYLRTGKSYSLAEARSMLAAARDADVAARWLRFVFFFRRMRTCASSMNIMR